nr:YetF domain-containing protein [Rhodoplanes tepidamans]
MLGSWSDLGRVVLVGTLAYVALVLILRISGKRTLSKLNAFDLVVTVALGSVLATVLLSKDVSLAEGVLALALLVGLQYVIAWMSVRVEWFQSLVKAEPTLLLRDGRFLDRAMREQRITREEILAAARASGIESIADTAAVVLETDGTISVIGSRGGDGARHADTAAPASALSNVAIDGGATNRGDARAADGRS